MVLQTAYNVMGVSVFPMAAVWLPELILILIRNYTFNLGWTTYFNKME